MPLALELLEEAKTQGVEFFLPVDTAAGEETEP